MHFVYIVRCADGTLYTGYARDPKQREKKQRDKKQGIERVNEQRNYERNHD